MGWGRYFFLGSIGQQMDIEEQRSAMLQSRVNQNRIDRNQNDRINALNQEIHDLQLYIGGLSQLLISKGVVTEAELDRLASSAFGPPKADSGTNSP